MSVRAMMLLYAACGLSSAGCSAFLGAPARHREPEPGALVDACSPFGAEGCRAACIEGDGASCNVMGAALELGELGESDHAAASSYYRKGCEAGFPQSCNNLAWLYVLGRGVEPDGRLALALFDRAFDQLRARCDTGSVGSCRAAVALHDKVLLDDDRRLLAVLDRGCRLGDAPACRRGAEVRRSLAEPGGGAALSVAR
jgi:TPR repeat protein